MQRTPSTGRRVRIVAATAAAGLLAAIGLTAPAQAGGYAGRWAGPNRYATATELFTQYHGCSRTNGDVVVASGEGYHDALAGNFLAGQGDNGGMLLTAGARLSTETRSGLLRVMCSYVPNRVKRVYVVDGGARISDQTVAEIDAALTPRRVSEPKPQVLRIRGADPYATAAAVATAEGTVVGTTQKYGRTAIVASGENFPDALAASPLVYAQRMPLLFTRAGQLPPVTASALAALDIDTVLLLGGTTAVSPAVEARLRSDYRVVRVAGANRQLTAIALAKLEIADFGFDNDLTLLARGDDYPDALAGGQLAAGNGTYAPVLLTQAPGALGGHTKAYLLERSAQLRGQVGAFGGTAAISEDTLRGARRAAIGRRD